MLHELGERPGSANANAYAELIALSGISDKRCRFSETGGRIFDNCNGRSLVVPLRNADQFACVDLDCSAECNEFGHVYPPLPQFNLRDERLPLTESPSNFGLRDARRLPRLHEVPNYSQVEIGSKGCQIAAPVDNQRAIETRI